MNQNSESDDQPGLRESDFRVRWLSQGLRELAFRDR